jgi:hypothetical protein
MISARQYRHPCHNAARWLAETLESALAQTWPEMSVRATNFPTLALVASILPSICPVEKVFGQPKN